MPVQSRTDNLNFPFILSGDSLSKDVTILKDTGRTATLVFGTLMAKVAASGKFVPYTDNTATDGTAIPAGIYLGDTITAAAIVAADVVNCPMLVGGSCTVDTQQLVIENSKALTTIIGATTVYAQTVEDALRKIGIFVESTIDITGLET